MTRQYLESILPDVDLNKGGITLITLDRPGVVTIDHLPSGSPTIDLIFSLLDQATQGTAVIQLDDGDERPLAPGTHRFAVSHTLVARLTIQSGGALLAWFATQPGGGSGLGRRSLASSVPEAN